MIEEFSSSEFLIGQRWASEMEPELGIGRVEAVDGRRIQVRFPDSDLLRMYAAGSAPLKRVIFHPGDRVGDASGRSITIDAVETEAGLNVYCGQEVRLREDCLAGAPALDTPKARIMAGQRDASALFDLRLDVLDYRHRMARSPVRGFVGGRVDLIPHQMAIASEVSRRYRPRVLLADETGLGKTIEAGLILHRLIVAGRIHRVLIVVPDALVVQWFVELVRRFNLQMRIYDADFVARRSAGARKENPFADEPMGICGFSFLAEATDRLRTQVADGGWDMVVVDEAHHIHPGAKLFDDIERLAGRVAGMLLITATPGHLTERSHFARLNLLDPQRYSGYDRFKAQNRTFKAIADIASAVAAGGEVDPAQIDRLAQLTRLPSDIIGSKMDSAAERRRLVRTLIDRWGTGREMFRTTRQTVAGFPGRQLHLVLLDAGEDPHTVLHRVNRELLADCGCLSEPGPPPLTADPRVNWLESYLRRHRNQKILLICRTAGKVNALFQALGSRTSIKIGRYHEQMTLVQRDRNAAWFAEPDGAVLLLCSEIGSEGRNFQFSRRLVLFDLPPDPELLEQRIGRLDRIGQTGVVQVTVPVVRGSGGERLARWYHDALNAFVAHVPAAGWVTRRLWKPLRELLDRPPDPSVETKMNRLIRAGRIAVIRQQRRLATGRDRLLELAAMPANGMDGLIEDIREIDADGDFETWIERLLDVWGIGMEPIVPHMFRLKPDHRYAQPLPGMRPSGMVVTMDRDTALSREDLGFLTWDHPLVIGAMDLFLGDGRGNAALVQWPAAGRAGLLLEMVFVLESGALTGHHWQRLLPPTPIRIVVDHHFKEAAGQLPDNPQEDLTDGSPSLLAAILPAASRQIPEMVDAGRALADARAAAVIEPAHERARRTLEDAIARLDTLGRANPEMDPAAIDAAVLERDAVLDAIAAARLRLDALRLIVMSPP